MKQTKLLPKKEIIQTIDQDEKFRFISRTLCSFHIFTNTFFVLIFEDLFQNSSFHPFVHCGTFCSYNDSNQHISMWVLQKSLPSFAYLTWRFKCRVYNTHLFRLKLIMELMLDHLCSKWMTFRGSTLMRQYLLFLEAVLN